MLISKEVIELVLVIVANCRDVEEPEIVLERDPEAAVIFIDKTNLLLGAIGPRGRLITPVTLPFLLAPRVADLNQAFCLAVIKCD